MRGHLAAWLPEILLISIAAAWIGAVRFDPFFWDTIQLASKHAHFYYEHQLALLPLPAAIDSGHPPFTGYYLAICWSFFGKTLPVSHFSMLPFLAGVLVFTYRIGRFWWDRRLALALVAWVACDPVFDGQSILVGPDLILLCWFAMGVYGILNWKKGWIVLSVLGLCTVSMRGMMTAAALGFFITL